MIVTRSYSKSSLLLLEVDKDLFTCYNLTWEECVLEQPLGKTKSDDTNNSFWIVFWKLCERKWPLEIYAMK